MNSPSISKAEWSVMEALWSKPGQSASQLTRSLLSKGNWAENTVRTMLKRLIEKGVVLTQEYEHSTRIYLPALDREKVVHSESVSFLDRVFQGASKQLLVHFAQNAKLTAREIGEIKKILDQSVKNKD